MRFIRIKSIMAVIVMMSVMNTATFADTAIQNFIKQKDYATGAFKDVSSTAWYVNDVQTVYELGLMGGKGASQFDPNGNLLIAEAIAMVARVHHIYYGGDGTIPPSGSNWYDGAVNYCIEKGIIQKSDFTSYTSKITRAQMAYLFANVLPEGEYSKINDISELPDVNASTSYSDSVFRLYNAGIVGGSDAKGTFKPDSNITRAEAAAIIKRVVFPKVRRTITLTSEEIIQAADNEVTLTEKEALAKNFYYNGKYYPFGYWMGQSEAEAKDNFLDLYRKAHMDFKPSGSKHFNNIYKEVFTYDARGSADLMFAAWNEYTVNGQLHDEFIYEAITKGIVTKYPILTTGTTEQKVQRQLEQIRELAKWMAENTSYGDEDGLQNLIKHSVHDDMEEYHVFRKEEKDFWKKSYSETDPKAYYNLLLGHKASVVEYYRNGYEASKGRIYEGVCEGYAQLAKDVLRQMGIETVYVHSDTHAWNVVMFANGATAHVEFTESGKGQVTVFNFIKGKLSSYRYQSESFESKLTSSINVIKSGRLMAAMNYRGYEGSGANSNYDKVPEGEGLSIFGTHENWGAYNATLRDFEALVNKKLYKKIYDYLEGRTEKDSKINMDVISGYDATTLHDRDYITNEEYKYIKSKIGFTADSVTESWLKSQGKW